MTSQKNKANFAQLHKTLLLFFRNNILFNNKNFHLLFFFTRQFYTKTKVGSDNPKCSANIAKMMQCEQDCIQENQMPKCVCKQGFILNRVDKTKCDDVNECNFEGNKCSSDEACKNSDGGYVCLNKRGKNKCALKAREFIIQK
jgi:hypothetical protein